MQLTSLQTELAEERKFGRELLTKLTERNAAPPAAEKPASLRDHISEVKDVIELLGIGRGSGGASKGTDWGEVAADVGKEVLKSLTVLGTAIITRQPVKPGAVNNRPAPAAAVSTQPQITAPAQPSQPAQAETVTSPNETGEAMSVIQQFSDQFGGLFDEVSPFLVDQFIRGDSGMQFRDWFIERHGSFTYNAIRRMDEKTIVGILDLRRTQAPQHVQEQLAQLAPPEEVAGFIAEFLSDDPAEEEPEPAQATAPRKTAAREMAPQPKGAMNTDEF